MHTPLIEIREVTRTFLEGGQRRTILDRASATIAAGESVALLGRSGSGKSTLLNLLSGIDAPSAGSIIINGIHLQQLNERERTLFRRQHIGFVFQFFNLIPTLTVLENVLLPLELQGRLTSSDHQRVGALLAQVGLEERLQAFPDTLSGGEQQRVAIARALIHDPLLVLADEPTGNLDASIGEQVLGLLDSMTRQAGKTMVMVTHDQAIAARADRILSLEAGQLVERTAVEAGI